MNSDFGKFDLEQQDKIMADLQSAAFKDFQNASNSNDRSSASRAFAMLAISRNGMMSNLAKRRLYESTKQVS